MRYLMAVVLAALLAACNAGSSSPTIQPLPTIGESAGSIGPLVPAASPSVTASPSEPAMISGCESTWSRIDLSGVQTIGDLDALAAEVDATFGQCASLDEWLAAGQDALPMLDVGVLRGWAAARCAVDGAINETPVCTELSS